MKKAIIALLSVSVAAVAAVGCSSKDNGGSGGADAGQVTTYTMGVQEAKLVWGGPITSKLTEKTGVELKYDAVVGDLFQKWDLWLAANDYPDIIRLDAEHLQKYVDAGAVIPLEDLLDKHGANIKDKWGKYYNMLRHPDGHIYGLYSVNLAEKAPANAQPGFVVQYDVLKEAGYPQIKTLDDLHKVVKAYAEKHPKIDGKDTIAYGAAMNSWTINIFFNNPAIAASGRPDHGNFIVGENGDVNWNPTSEGSREYLKFLNKMYNEGLLDKEAFSMGDQELQSKMAQGRVLAAYAPAWFSNPPEATLRAAGQLDRLYAHIPVYFNASVKDHSNAKTPANGGTHIWAITTKAKNPEKIVKFFDYLFSDEGQVLTQWGIEGTHYEVKDGKRVQTDSWIQKKVSDPDAIFKEGFRSEITGSGNWFGIGDGAKLADGDFATPVTAESVRREYDARTKEVLDQYKIQTWADLLPPVEKVPSYLWQLQPPSDSEFKVIDQKLDDLRRKSTPTIVMAKDEAEFNKQFDTFVDGAKKIGLEKFEKDFTKVWKDFVAEYNKSLK